MEELQQEIEQLKKRGEEHIPESSSPALRDQINKLLEKNRELTLELAEEK